MSVIMTADRTTHAFLFDIRRKGHNTLTESFKSKNTAVASVFLANTAITGGGIE